MIYTILKSYPEFSRSQGERYAPLRAGSSPALMFSSGGHWQGAMRQATACVLPHTPPHQGMGPRDSLGLSCGYRRKAAVEDKSEQKLLFNPDAADAHLQCLNLPRNTRGVPYLPTAQTL